MGELDWNECEMHDSMISGEGKKEEEVRGTHPLLKVTETIPNFHSISKNTACFLYIPLWFCGSFNEFPDEDVEGSWGTFGSFD